MLNRLVLILSLIFLCAFKALDPELKDYVYPFPVQHFAVKVKDQKFQMAYMDVAPQGTIKGVVVLLHGKNFSGSYWEKTIRNLVTHQYRVIVPDQIGFGKSSKPEHFPYTFQLLSQFTRDLLATLKIEKFSLVGHSMGGMLATRMALMYPEDVTKLILVNPIGLEDWKTKVPYRTVNELYQMELKNDEAKIRDYQMTSYFDGKWKPEYEKGIEILVGWTKHPKYSLIAWNSALTTDMIFTQPVIYEMKHLRMPTLLLLGTRDRTAVGKGWAEPSVKAELGRYDLLGKEVIKLIPQGTLVELPWIGHLPQVEDFESYWKKLIGYLEK